MTDVPTSLDSNCYLQLLACFQCHLCHVCGIMNESAGCIFALNHFPARSRPYCKPTCATSCFTPKHNRSRAAKAWVQLGFEINPCQDFSFRSTLARIRSKWEGNNRCSMSSNWKGIGWSVSVLVSSLSEYCVTAMNLESRTRKFRSQWLGFVPQHISHHSLNWHCYAHTPFHTAIPAYVKFRLPNVRLLL